MASITKVWAYYVIPDEGPKGYARYHAGFAINPGKQETAALMAKAEADLAGRKGHVELEEITYDDATVPEQRTFDHVTTFSADGETTKVTGEAVKSTRIQFEQAVKVDRGRD